jgi:hypothetical protein
MLKVLDGGKWLEGDEAVAWMEKLKQSPVQSKPAIPEIAPGSPEAEEVTVVTNRLRSAADLYQLELEPQTFLPMLGQPGYIVKGETHILAASPKVGKTALLFACVVDWLEQDHTVLWFSEESERVWTQRLSRLGPELFDKRGLSTHPSAHGFVGANGPLSNLAPIPTTGRGPKWMMKVIGHRDGERKQEWAHDAPILQRNDVLIIDTLRLLGVEDENTEEMARAVEPFVAYSQQTGCTLIIVHHKRKSGGEHGKGVSGHHSLTGSVDNIVEIDRDGEGSRRSITIIGRSVEEAKGTYERVEILTPQGYGTGVYEFQYVGAVKEVTRIDVESRIRAILTADKQTTAQIMDQLNVETPVPTLRTVQRALSSLAYGGLAIRYPDIHEDAEKRTVKWTAPKTDIDI